MSNTLHDTEFCIIRVQFLNRIFNLNIVRCAKYRKSPNRSSFKCKALLVS